MVERGLGPLTFGAFVCALAIVPIVVLEWIVLWKRLPVGPGRALWVSLLANVGSTLSGFLVAVFVEMAVRAAGISAGENFGFVIPLAMFFVVAYPIELVVVRGMVVAPSGDVARATLWANGLSYAALAIFWVLSIHVFGPGL